MTVTCQRCDREGSVWYTVTDYGPDQQREQVMGGGKKRIFCESCYSIHELEKRVQDLESNMLQLIRMKELIEN